MKSSPASKVAALKVISRTSTQSFKSSPNNLPQIAKQLGVVHILEGSVQRANDRVRVNVQLINAPTDAHLWAETYDRKLTDIFAVESEIAKTIAEVLQAKISGSERSSIAKTPTVNPDAYEAYLKGRYFFFRPSDENLSKAIAYFQQSVDLDPGFGPPYSGMSDAYLWAVSNEELSPPRRGKQRSRRQQRKRSNSVLIPPKPTPRSPITRVGMSMIGPARIQRFVRPLPSIQITLSPMISRRSAWVVGAGSTSPSPKESARRLWIPSIPPSQSTTLCPLPGKASSKKQRMKPGGARS